MIEGVSLRMKAMDSKDISTTTPDSLACLNVLLLKPMKVVDALPGTFLTLKSLQSFATEEETCVFKSS